MRLYELAATYDQIRALSEDGGAESDWEQALLDLEDEATVKMLAIGRIIQESVASQKAIAVELDRLDARAQAAANAEKRLKAYLLDAMQTMGLPKVQDATLTLAVQKSSPSVQVVDEHAVPAWFRFGSVKVQYDLLPEGLRELAAVEYDKRGMLALHKDGQEVPGVEFVQASHVRIR